MDVRPSRSGPSAIGATLLWIAAVAAGLALFALMRVSRPQAVEAAPTESPGPSGVGSPTGFARSGASLRSGVVADTGLPESAVPRALEGRVVDPATGPVSGLELVVGGQLVTSDEDGAFRLRSSTDRTRIEVRSRGYTLLGCEGGDPLNGGSWTPLVVLVAPRAAASVRVSDSSGSPLVDVVVSATLDVSETMTIRQRASISVEGPRLAISGDDGVAWFEELWADRNLAIALVVDGQRLASTARVGGRLCLDGAGSRAGAIALAPGWNPMLEAVLEAGPRVAGRVLDESGRPVPGARVEITDAGRTRHAHEPVEVLTSDAEGRFGGVVRAARLLGPLRVAVDPCLDPVRGALARLGYRARTAGVARPRGATLELELDDPRIGALELRLEPHLPVEGVVRGHSGRSGARIWAVPAGEAALPAQHEGRVAQDGTFALWVPDGVHDLLVEDPERGGEDIVRFPGIRAGTRGVELELPASRAVTIRVRVAGIEHPIGSLLVRRFLSGTPDDTAARTAEPETIVDPECSTLGRNVGGETVDTVQGFGSLDGPLELRSGCFALGVHVASADGKSRTSPLVGPPLRFEEGEHTVTFEPCPAGTVQGRVTGVRAGERWAVALVGEDDRALPLAPALSFHPLATQQGVSAAGSFLLPSVPLGRHRLRLGSPEELERGGFRLEQTIEVLAGENPPVELALR